MGCRGIIYRHEAHEDSLATKGEHREKRTDGPSIGILRGLTIGIHHMGWEFPNEWAAGGTGWGRTRHPNRAHMSKSKS